MIEPNDKISLVTSSTEIMTSQPFETFQNTFTLRGPRVAIFADIIKIMAMFIKKSLKTRKKIKEYVDLDFDVKNNFYQIFTTC